MPNFSAFANRIPSIFRNFRPQEEDPYSQINAGGLSKAFQQPDVNNNPRSFEDRYNAIISETPERNRLRELLQTQPQYNPTKTNKLGAILGGLSAGVLGQDPSKATQGYLEAPYKRSMQNYETQVEAARLGADYEGEDIKTRLGGLDYARKGEQLDYDRNRDRLGDIFAREGRDQTAMRDDRDFRYKRDENEAKIKREEWDDVTDKVTGELVSRNRITGEVRSRTKLGQSQAEIDKAKRDEFIFEDDTKEKHAIANDLRDRNTQYGLANLNNTSRQDIAKLRIEARQEELSKKAADALAKAAPGKQLEDLRTQFLVAEKAVRNNPALASYIDISDTGVSLKNGPWFSEPDPELMRQARELVDSVANKYEKNLNLPAPSGRGGIVPPPIKTPPDGFTLRSVR